MLGAVKMEGHEHAADWSTYYGEPEVGNSPKQIYMYFFPRRNPIRFYTTQY